MSDSSDDDIVWFTTLSTLRELGRRALFPREQKHRLDAEMKPLIDEIAPGLIVVFGVGYHVVAAPDRRRRRPASDQIRSRSQATA